jgi:HEAT repeat protein
MEENNTNPEASIEDVIKVLQDPDLPIQEQLLYQLSDLAGDEYTRFKNIWPEIPEWRRQALLEELERVYEADFLLSFESIFRFSLKDSLPQIRFISLRALQGYQVKDLIPTFIKILYEDPDEEIRAIAGTILGKYVYQGELDKLPEVLLKEIESCLLDATLGDETNLVRQKALESLGYSSNKQVTSLIEKAFKSDEIKWKTSAIFAMGRSCDPHWEPAVLEMLAHVSPEIRFEATRAAGELEIYQAKPLLLELLQDPNQEVRMAAAWSLSQIGGAGLQQVFQSLLEDSVTDGEARIIEEALDNLIFNQSIGLHDTLDMDDDIDFTGLGQEYDENWY